MTNVDELGLDIFTERDCDSKIQRRDNVLVLASV
jgi:hypothetical protein